MYELMYIVIAVILLLFCYSSTIAEQFDTFPHYYIGDILRSRYSTERVIQQSSNGKDEADTPDKVTIVDITHNSAPKQKHSKLIKRDYNSYDSAWGSESSELSERFFNESNIDYLLDALRKSVYNYTERVNGTPIDIGTQPRKDFICIMQSALAIHRQHIDSRLPIETQLTMLNSEFIDRITPKVAGQTVSYLKFLNDISKPYTLVDIPESTRLDSKEVRLFSF